jgi:hypothetical protein
MDVESLAKQLILQNMTPEQQNAVLESVRASLLEARNNQKRRVSENVGMVVEALKKIEADIRAKYDDLGGKIETRVNSIKDGRDGIDGRDGKDGKDGRPGRDGATGPMGPAGRDGVNGVDGEDGVSVIDAKIDFDGSLVITLSNGREINVGEVVAADVAEKIRVLTYGGNSGGGGGTSGLTYKGTWNASTNTPTLITSSGTNGDYYIVSVAGTTDLNGITDWQPGDWVIFNGTAWQKIDQSWAIAGANDNITSMTGITGGISSPDFIQFDTGATVTNAAGRLYWDSTQQTLTVGLNANIAADIGQTLYAYATNDEAVTINKGQPVYMFAAQGDRVSVKLAYNTGDATSAKTLGICAENIAAGQAGMILCQGVQDGLNLAAFNPGDTLYLGATAGTLTNTKPYAPNHLVYIGVVERANAGNGRLYVRVQNGYELDELHNVSAQNPTNGQVLIYNESTSLWTKNTLTDGTGITITEGAGSITVTNAGVTSAVAGTGISVSGATGAVTVTNTGVTSLTGTANEIDVSASTGAVTLSLPSSIDVNVNGTVGAATPNTGAFTTLSASSTVSGTGFSDYLASPPAIGGTAPAAGSFTSLTDAGNLTFTGTGNRITGDFSNATIANRVMFQTSTVNSSTVVASIPNGTGTTSGFFGFNNSDPINASFASVQANSGDVRYQSGITGTGTYLPMTFYTGGSERMRIDSSGNVTIGTNTIGIGAGRELSIDCPAASTGALNFGVNGTLTGYLSSSASSLNLTAFGASIPILLGTNNTERARITAGGNLEITNAALLGYGTGSGGTVTQATNKSTAVTLNKPTGQITMNNAALAAGATVTFIVNNTLVTTSDTVIVTPSNNANYTVLCNATTAGSFYVRVTNITAGSLSQALVISFAVIKGATS